MSDATTNPFVELGPWNSLEFGGVPVTPALVEIDGVKTTDEWTEQKSKESSGKVYVYAGTTVDKPKLTLEACDKADFDDLWRLWLQLLPVPGQGSAVPATKAPAQTYAIGSPSAADSTAASSSALNNVNPTSNPTSTVSKDNTGPRPPTVSVRNAILLWHGITAIARGEWDGPKPTSTNSWRVVLTVVPQQLPKPAGAGAMAPAKPVGDQFTLPSADSSSSGGGSSSSGTLNRNAGAGAAGT